MFKKYFYLTLILLTIYSCNNRTKKHYTVEDTIRVLSKDYKSIKYEYILSVEFNGKENELTELNLKQNSDIIYYINAMSTSRIRSFFEKYNQLDIDNAFLEERVKKDLQNYLIENNFEVLDFKILEKSN